MSALEQKFLVVGAGSIGSRHLKNLLALGVKDVEVCEPSEPARARLKTWFSGPVHSKLSKGLASRPDVALITTPTHLHIAAALECARAGCHLFIEKPLSHELAGLEELQTTLNEKERICLVGCNMRFHPGLSLLKQCLAERKIGKVWGVRIEFGHYLPNWRPGKDFRKTYSANSKEGGGVILDCIHELDYARWFFGHVTSCVAYAPKTSILNIDVEENVDMVLQTRHNAWIEIHLDYLQKAYRRRCSVSGEGGALEWDWHIPGVRWFHAETKEWAPLGADQKFEVNDMYVEEMRHFLRCLSKKEEPIQNLKRGAEVLCLALALKKALKSLDLVPVEYGPWF
ncbi:MAG: Gfo/Idh/MocA family oxidoreductase [Verrucomicrobiae bacterium]|nr:Gfo/Idh/MocA family oxidoreductase [Verrucomicrobiae bacterium]